jgi:hypothetical protein
MHRASGAFFEVAEVALMRVNGAWAGVAVVHLPVTGCHGVREQDHPGAKMMNKALSLLLRGNGALLAGHDRFAVAGGAVSSAVWPGDADRCDLP